MVQRRSGSGYMQSLRDGIRQTPAYKKVKRKQSATPKQRTMSKY